MSGEPKRVLAGSLSSLRPGEVRVVVLAREPSGIPREALVMLDAAGEPRAYLNRCTHLPISLDGGSRRFFGADPQLLVCGTHGARFTTGSGRCVDGPCGGRGLTALRLEIVGDFILVVDASGPSGEPGI